jgi:GAF domain-containing protein
MKRRSKVSSARAKAQGGSAPKPKHRTTSTEATRATSFAANAETKIVRLTRELAEAQEQQRASSELLRAISQSDFQLQAVLQSVAENAARLCRSDGAVIFQLEDGVYRFVAGYSLVPAFLEIEQQAVISPGSETLIGRAAITRKVVRIDDALTDSLYEKKEDAKVEGNRSMIGVPLIRDAEPVGVIGLGRRRLDPFGEREIEIATTFAAEAVVAIESTRLLHELRQSLDRQTAASDVLQVISASAGDLEPIFATMLEKAVRICDATFGNIYRWDGEALHLLASYNTPPALAEARKHSPLRSYPNTPVGRMVAHKAAVHSADMTVTPGYIDRGDPGAVDAVELGGVRTLLAIPMLKENELIGSFSVYRQEVRPFSEKQIELVKNFAAQAVIAIENARLLSELRQRTTDLTDALEQQTASSDVLSIISNSAGELQPVFDAILANATRLCGASFGTLWLYENDGQIRMAAFHGRLPGDLRGWRVGTMYRPKASVPIARVFQTHKPVQILDLKEDRSYIEADPLAVASVDVGGIRSLIAVPMIKGGTIIGAMTIYRREVRSFSDKQIAVVANFAAQAVIAIENARLLSELRERTDQLAAQSQDLAKLNQHLEQRVADQVGEIERMSRLRRFLPPQVADLIVASGSEKQLESHRREITALFCDLRGFTGFTESADAEDVIALLREYHAAIGEKIIKYSGTLERYAGDGVMVVFNDPVPVENPALQAVLMALEMREAIGALTETWRRWGHEIGFGIGISHGFATLGTIGFEGRFDYAAIGTVSNVASRLCDEAKPGQILISPRVLTKVENAVKVEPVGEFELKGIRRPLAAYNVVGAV